MPPKNPRPGHQFQKVVSYIKDMFDVITQQFLPTEKNSLNIGYDSLPALYRESVRAHGGYPDPTTEDSLIEVAQAYLDAVKTGMEADLRHTLITQEKTKKDDSEVNLTEMVQGILDKAEFEVKRVVDSEAQRARSTGAFEGVVHTAAKIGIDDPTLFFVIVRDGKCCGECLSLHMLPDGVTPRVWKMSEISKGYHKKGSDIPSLAGEHPNCRCSPSICPPNYSFSSAGNLTYKYEGYDEWTRQRGLEEADSLE
jgi:hypothetical protein